MLAVFSDNSKWWATIMSFLGEEGHAKILKIKIT